jgi:hypothetical protein
VEPDYYQTVSAIGKPIIDIFEVELKSTCIETIWNLEYCYGWSFNMLTAFKYLWRLGQKSPIIVDDVKKAITYFEWELECEFVNLSLYIREQIKQAITELEQLIENY